MKTWYTHWPLAASLISLFMLATAHAFETFANMFPCPLCLQQREPYWMAIGISLSGLILQKARPAWPILRLTCLLLAFTFLYGAGVAAYHSGVEWGIFQSGCTSTGFDPNAMGSLDKPMAVGKCDDRTVILFGISMANMNAVGSMLFCVLSLYAAAKLPNKAASAL